MKDRKRINPAPEQEIPVEHASGVFGDEPVSDNISCPEESISTFLDCLPAGTFITDTEGTILAYNQWLVKNLGFGKSELIAKGVDTIFAEPGMWSILKKVVAYKGSIEEYEIHIRTKDAGILHVQAYIHMVTLNGRKAIITMLSDNTKYRLLLESAEESRKRAGLMLEISGMMRVVLNPDGTIIEANEPLLRFAGIGIGDAVGKRLDEAGLCPEDNPVTFTVLVERALLNRGIVYDDVRVKLRSGKSVWLRLHGIPITISGRIAAVEMLASDITFYKKTQEILEQNRKLWTGLMDALKQNPDGNRICRTAKDGEQ